MKIIFMGTPEFAVPSLKILLENDIDIAAVVTVPDKKKGRGLNVSVSAVKSFALQHDLKILQPENLKDENFFNEMKSLQPDLIVVVAFRIMPEKIFSLPKSGSVNLHASLLPKYRGAAPINWAIINGDSESGVSTFFLKKKVDTGNIILQRKINIDPDDNAGTLHDKLSVLGAETILETVKLIESGNIIEHSQDDSQASPAPKIFREDCKIDWNNVSLKIHDLIRGLSPYPAAFTTLDNKILKIYRSAHTDTKSGSAPGTIITDDKKLFACTSDNLIQIIELQMEGKKRINAVDFINGLGKNKELILL